MSAHEKWVDVLALTDVSNLAPIHSNSQSSGGGGAGGVPWLTVAVFNMKKLSYSGPSEAIYYQMLWEKKISTGKSHFYKIMIYSRFKGFA